MKAVDRPFSLIINGSSQFVIPVFQRDYSWTETQCSQLWDDIVTVASSESDKGHFLGSVVYIATGNSSAGFTQWLLIDGQQRVTTLTLLLTALRDHIVEAGWKGDENDPTPKRIDAYFLRNLQEEGSREHKLMLRRHDQHTLNALVNGEELPSEPSERLVENYEWFRDSLKGVDPALVYRGIGRLVLVDVTLDRKSDDPQLIFESLNSTGVDLSESDLIRNFLLMRLPEDEQTRCYEMYWSRIEKLFRGAEKVFDSFVRDYLALKLRSSKQEKASQVYQAFRRNYEWLIESSGGVDALLEDMLSQAKHYAAFSIGIGVSGQLADSLGRLRRLVDVPALLVARLMELREEAALTESELLESIDMLESYVFRRAICGEQTRGYWQLFANIAYKLDVQRPLDILKVELARQRENYRFPADVEFRRALVDRDLYGLRVCTHLLERLENHGSKEKTDVSSYTIEHVMPQSENLKPEWKKMLGPDWQQIQSTWLHRLGNLTLTGFNSVYSDKPFEEKRTIPGGFNESSVRLNKFIREQEEWTESAIKERGELLALQAIKIWPQLNVEAGLVAEVEAKEKRARAARRSSADVEMSKLARELFSILSDRVQSVSEDILEVAESKTVSYHGPEFFLEVLPRKRILTLLLPLDFNV